MPAPKVFDVAAFGDSVSDLRMMAKVAENAERYDDMCAFMKKLVAVTAQDDKTLTIEDRNLLSVAYKNVIGARRASWRTLKNGEDGDGVTGDVKQYQEQIEAEIETICNDMLTLLQDMLIEKKDEDITDPTKTESQVFFLKMAGDYFRYLAESIGGDDYMNSTRKFYDRAWTLATKENGPNCMKTTSPIRLGLALNYSVCHFEILKNKESACELAKKAFDDAISELDQLKEEDYRDSTLIMQLLRDNLTLWTASEHDDVSDVQVEELAD